MFVCKANAQDMTERGVSWKDIFYDTYQLNHEYVKRIPKPYIPERNQYYQTNLKLQSSMFAPDSVTLIFHWRSGLSHWGLYTDSFKMSLHNVLSYVLDIPGYSFEGSPELLEKELPGDWIVRNNITEQQKLSDLEKIIKTAWQMDIRFERKHVKRDIYIASGNYREPSILRYLITIDETINVFSHHEEQSETAGGGSGAFELFLNKLGNRFHTQIFDETNDSAKQVQWRWRQPMPEDPQKELSDSIDDITEQTGIQFTKKQRTIPIWFIVEPTNPNITE